MKPERKREVIEVVRRSPLAKARTLEELGIARSTYCRWQHRFRRQGEVSLGIRTAAASRELTGLL